MVVIRGVWPAWSMVFGDICGCRRTWFVWATAELMLNRCLVVVDWVCGCWFLYFRHHLSGSGEFGCFQLYFHWVFPLSHYFTNWHWFELVFAHFPALLHSVVKVIYLLNLCGGVCFLPLC